MADCGETVQPTLKPILDVTNCEAGGGKTVAALCQNDQECRCPSNSERCQELNQKHARDELVAACIADPLSDQEEPSDDRVVTRPN